MIYDFTGEFCVESFSPGPWSCNHPPTHPQAVCPEETPSDPSALVPVETNLPPEVEGKHKGIRLIAENIVNLSIELSITSILTPWPTGVNSQESSEESSL